MDSRVLFLWVAFGSVGSHLGAQSPALRPSATGAAPTSRAAPPTVAARPLPLSFEDAPALRGAGAADYLGGVAAGVGVGAVGALAPGFAGSRVLHDDTSSDDVGAAVGWPAGGFLLLGEGDSVPVAFGVGALVAPPLGGVMGFLW